VAHTGKLTFAGKEITYTEVGRTLLERRIVSCVSKSCRGTFKIEYERYVLLVEWQHAGQKNRGYLYCENAWDGSPAGCACDRTVLEEHKLLVPQYRRALGR
jgi:hypothetical protein